MARPILSEYGPDAHKIQQPRITKNGPAGTLHSDPDYCPPEGPLHMMNTGVGLRGGYNYGNQGTQGPQGGIPCRGTPSGGPETGTAAATRHRAGAQNVTKGEIREEVTERSHTRDVHPRNSGPYRR